MRAERERQLLILLGLAALAWLFLARLEVTADAPGAIRYRIDTQYVQHREGGVIREIFVQEGDRVTAGQVLIRLDPDDPETDREAVETRLRALKLNRDRLRAELKRDPVPSGLMAAAARGDELAISAQAVLQSRLQRLAAELSLQEQIVEQRQSERESARLAQSSGKKLLKTVREQLEISRQLVDRNLSSRLSHLQVQREVQRLEREITLAGADVNRTEAAIREAQARRVAIERAFDEDARSQLDRRLEEIQEQTQLLEKLTRGVDQTTLISPVDGIVKHISNQTLGGVVAPGEATVEIVPTAEALIAVLELPTYYRPLVSVGQTAVLRLRGPDASRFRELEGEVIRISADAHIKPQGLPYYEVTVGELRPRGGDSGSALPQVAGLEVTGSVVTGERTVISTLLAPLFSGTSRMLREP